MCGASSLLNDWQNMGPLEGQRRLMRNASHNSCNSYQVNNVPHDDTAVQDDRAVQAGPIVWDQPTPQRSAGHATSADTSGVSWSLAAGGCCHSSDSTLQQQQCCGERRQPLQQPGPQGQLLVGTSSGVYLLDLASHAQTLLGLQSVPVAHVHYSSSNGLLLAACAVPEEVELRGAAAAAAAKQAAGLYCLNLQGLAAASSSSSSSGVSGGCGGASVPAVKLWTGSTSSCAFAPEQQPACGDDEACQGVPRVYIGTQPAGLLFSDDGGSSWSCCSLHEAPNAEQWFRRQPPYEASVRSISFSSSITSSRRSSCGSAQPAAAAPAGAAADALQHEAGCGLLVAVEVGGAFAAPLSAISSGSSSDSGSSNLSGDQPVVASGGWQDISQGLCRDVHALQADPFNQRRLYAVCGSGHLPGGLYRCKGQGQKWKRLFGDRYSVGMAISGYQKGRMLLASADKPPAIGCSLHESVDAGRTWANVTDDVADAAAVLTDHEPGLFEATPLTAYVHGGLIVACASGHVFLGTTKPLGGFGIWQLVAQLPHAVTCMAGVDPLVAPVSIARS